MLEAGAKLGSIIFSTLRACKAKPWVFSIENGEEATSEDGIWMVQLWRLKAHSEEDTIAVDRFSLVCQMLVAPIRIILVPIAFDAGAARVTWQVVAVDDLGLGFVSEWRFMMLYRFLHGLGRDLQASATSLANM